MLSAIRTKNGMKAFFIDLPGSGLEKLNSGSRFGKNIQS
jgi:hypothetical protein